MCLQANLAVAAGGFVLALTRIRGCRGQVFFVCDLFRDGVDPTLDQVEAAGALFWGGGRSTWVGLVVFLYHLGNHIRLTSSSRPFILPAAHTIRTNQAFTFCARHTINKQLQLHKKVFFRQMAKQVKIYLLPSSDINFTRQDRSAFSAQVGVGGGKQPVYPPGGHF